MNIDLEIFEKQLKFKPEVVNKKDIKYKNIIVGGMGGSALPARALQYIDPQLHLHIHSDFELPPKIPEDVLCVAISYSGNTRETLSFAKEVLNKKMPLAVITAGGKLLDLAKEHSLPYVSVPTGMQPRDAAIYNLKSLLAIINREDVSKELENLDLKSLNIPDLSKELDGKITLVYSSTRNEFLGRLFSIFINESGKLPSFFHVLPEMTHNEMQGILAHTNKEFINDTRMVIIKDEEDNEGVKDQIEAFSQEAEENGMRVVKINLPKGILQKVFTVWITCRDTAHRLAHSKGISPDEVAIIESFKKRLK